MVRARVATETTKKGLRRGPNSANEAKQLGSYRTPGKNKTKQQTKIKQVQATSEICWKVTEILSPKR